MRRYIAIFGLIVVGAIVGISFYQPPMRLMPAPALFLDGQTNAFSGAPETTDPQISLFYATNRLPIGPRDNRLAILANHDNRRACIERNRRAESGTFRFEDAHR